MNGWHPVSLSADLSAAAPIGVRIHGHEIVLWRDNDGLAHAWEDRCPHRGMRLSFGFVRDGNLACLYHGWQYDPQGQCRHIPAHPQIKVPSTIHTNSYGVHETQELIWVTIDGAAVPPSPPATTGMRGVRSVLVQSPATNVRRTLGMGSGDIICHIGDIVIMLHEPARTETILHILAAAHSREHLEAISRWAQDLRLAIEAGARTVPAVGEAA